MFNERLEEESVETHQFVLDLLNMIESTSKMTRGHLKCFQNRYRAHFDHKAKVRYLEIGDKDIILLPTDSN